MIILRKRICFDIRLAQVEAFEVLLSIYSSGEKVLVKVIIHHVMLHLFHAERFWFCYI